MKKFFSKKNDVFLTEQTNRNVVYKVHTGCEAYINEKIIYLELVKSNVDIKCPELILHNDSEKTFVLEYVKGKTLVKELDELEEKNAVDEAVTLMVATFNWVMKFHQVDYIRKKKLALWDLNFRNFIVDDNGEITGLDFEEVAEGRFEDDVAKIAAFQLTYDPAFTEFKQKVSEKFIDYLISERGFDHKKLRTLIEKELKSISKRRKNISLTS